MLIYFCPEQKEKLFASNSYLIDVNYFVDNLNTYLPSSFTYPSTKYSSYIPPQLPLCGGCFQTPIPPFLYIFIYSPLSVLIYPIYINWLLYLPLSLYISPLYISISLSIFIFVSSDIPFYSLSHTHTLSLSIYLSIYLSILPRYLPYPIS